MRIYLFGALLLVVSCIQSAAQQVCASFDYQQKQLELVPSLKSRISEIEAFIGQKLNATEQVDGGNSDNPSVITIPVVIHILYNNAEQNVPDIFVENQMKVLNECF